MAPPAPLRLLSAAELARVSAVTVDHYEQSAEAFRRGTDDHDVSQNIEALLGNVSAEPPFDILDLGCGPGRDLATFRRLGHRAIGLDAAPSFAQMARERSGCEVLEQDLLQLDLPPQRFDGVFANAVLFHVPSQELARVLDDIGRALKPGGVLFCSNPHGPDREEWRGLRYCSFLSWETWSRYLIAAGLSEIEHYYRPSGRPRSQQPWLASVWQK